MVTQNMESLYAFCLQAGSSNYMNVCVGDNSRFNGSIVLGSNTLHNREARTKILGRRWSLVGVMR